MSFATNLEQNAELVSYWLQNTASGKAILRGIAPSKMGAALASQPLEETGGGFHSGEVQRLNAKGDLLTTIQALVRKGELQRVPKLTRVVVEVNPNGEVDVYGPTGIQVEIVSKLHTPDAKRSAVLETAAEKFVEAQLSKEGRIAKDNGKLLARANIQHNTLEAYSEAQQTRSADIDFSKALNTLREKAASKRLAQG